MDNSTGSSSGRGHVDEGASSASLTPAASSRVASPAVDTMSSLSEERLREASSDELRAMIASLVPSLQHYKLQYRMLAIESAEAVERIQVEMDMALREIDVLHTNDAVVRPEPDPNMRHVHVDVYNSMLQELHDLRVQNTHLESTVARQKRMVVQQEGEIASLNDRVSLLRDRLRENRHHLNRYRRTAAVPDTTSPMEPPFAALLHASDLMSERGTVTPRTPRRKRAPSTTPTPMTPRTAQPTLSRNIYHTPQTSQSVRHLQVPQTAPPMRAPNFVPGFIPQPVSATERTRGSGTTLLAAQDSEAEAEVSETPNDFTETQAGLLASQMLPTPTRNQDKNSASARPNSTQGRLFGQVRKSGVQPNEDDKSTKKARIESPLPPTSDGLGL